MSLDTSELWPGCSNLQDPGKRAIQSTIGNITSDSCILLFANNILDPENQYYVSSMGSLTRRNYQMSCSSHVIFALGSENTERISMKYEIKGPNFLERLIRMERLPYRPIDPKHEFHIYIS